MQGLRFADKEFLYLLLLLPVYWWLSRFVAHHLRVRLQKFFGEKNESYLFSSFDKRKFNWKLRLEIMILCLLILAMARPQIEGGRQKVKNEGIELMLLLDVSRSMLAEDVKPSRLDVAKRELIRLLDLSSGDRFGLVAFAGSAVLLSPMTTDRDAIKMYIESMSAEVVSNQGTDFGRALDLALEALDRGGMGDQDQVAVTRAVLIASDGEDHSESTKAKLEELVKNDIRVFSLAFGTEKGGPIPVKDSMGQTRGYLTDTNQQTVISKMNPNSLRTLAERGKGSFHHFTFSSDVISQIRQDLENLQKAKFNEGEVISYEEKYQGFLLFAFILGLFHLAIGTRKARGRIWKGRFEVEVA